MEQQSFAVSVTQGLRPSSMAQSVNRSLVQSPRSQSLFSRSALSSSVLSSSDRSHSYSQKIQPTQKIQQISGHKPAANPRAIRSQVKPFLGLTLAPDSDSGSLGDAKTRFATVELLGLTSANRAVSLNDGVGNEWVTTADSDGQFLFTNIPLSGTTQFTAQIQSNSGTVTRTTTIRRISSDSENAVLSWNAIALNTLRRDQAGSLEASRSLAIVHGAVFDAVNAIVGSGKGYRPLLDATPVDASAQAAAAGAAHRVLTQLYPNQVTQLDQALTQSLSQILDLDSSEQSGFRFGAAIADRLLLERSQDRSAQTAVDRPVIQPGQWRPTPPRFLPAAAVNWGRVTPFVLNRAAQFRPAAPPRLNSRAYAQDLNQVKRLGQIDSTTRTAAQTETARFWLGNAGTLTFPGMWNTVAEQAANRALEQAPQTLLKTARLFAQLNFALADAGIAAWDTKYVYRSWRPITAMRLAGADGNSATSADRSWQSFLETPAHPDYVSAHSTYSGAAAAVLKRFDSISSTLKFTSLDLPSQRSFRSFEQAATSVGLSRIYGGIHTRSANRSGLKLGKAIGNYVLQRFR